MSKTSNAPRSPVSATESGTFYACPVKWAAKYACDDARWKEDKRYKTGTETGSALHTLSEWYGLQGYVPRDPHPIVDMWLDALKHVAHPHTHWAIEQRVVVEIDGVPYEVKPDWYGPSDALPAAPKGMRALNDFKSSIDPKKYGIWDKAQKLADHQTLLYSTVLLADQPGLFRHLYIRKTSQVLMLEAQGLPPDAPAQVKEKAHNKAKRQPMSTWSCPSDTVLEPSEVKDAFERVVVPSARRLYSIRSKGQNVSPLDFEPNAGHCQDYGGCHLHPSKGGPCHVSLQDVQRAALGASSAMSFDLFGGLPINGPANTPAAPAAPAPAFAMPAPAAPAAPAPAFAMPAPAAPAPQAPALPPGYTWNTAEPAVCRDPSGAPYNTQAVVEGYAKYLASQQPAPAPAVVSAPVTLPTESGNAKLIAAFEAALAVLKS